MANIIKSNIIVKILCIVFCIVFLILFLVISINYIQEKRERKESKERKTSEEYLEIFNNNKEVFEEIKDRLLPIEGNYNIIYESGRIVTENLDSGGRTKEVIDSDIKDYIKNTVKDIYICEIKRRDYGVTFYFYRDVKEFSIAYILDKDRAYDFTYIEQMEDNWYECYRVYE